MASIQQRPLADDLPFGARIKGVDLGNVRDADVGRQINEIFLERGMIVFEDMEPSPRLHAAVSEIFGPLQIHALLKGVADEDAVPGLIEFNFDPEEADIFEVDGMPLCSYIPWHFDACYTRELNRGGVLRSLVIPPEGGMTGFADGMQLYQAISPEFRDRFETLNILYHSNLMFTRMRFGRPKSYHMIRLQKLVADLFDQTENAVRAIHPAIWTRPTGEKILHISPWQAAGIEGRENPEGDALLEALCQEIYAKMTPYWHRWKTTDMVIWDNWRFMHAVSGHRPEYARKVQRTTIQGDYGLGRFETGAENQQPAGMMV